MSTRTILVGVVLCLLLMAGALWYVSQSQEPVRTAQPRPAPALRATAPPVAPPVAAPPSAAPWTATPGPAGVASNDAMAARERQSQELDAMQADIAKSMREGRQPDPQKLDAALAKVAAAAGQSVVNGVNIDAVRNNLAIAQKMQALAAELDAESRKPGKLDTDRLRALVAQVQQLQSQMRADVSAPSSPMPPANAPAVPR
jgi:hypothetical protein